MFEAECLGVQEALLWILSREERRVVLETDSLLTVNAIRNVNNNMLEVGHVIDQCKTFLGVLPEVSVKHICKQANKVAHGLARLPCLVNRCNVLTSPPTHLLDTFVLDASV